MVIAWPASPAMLANGFHSTYWPPALPGAEPMTLLPRADRSSANLSLRKKMDDGRRQRPRYPLLEGGRGQQRGIGGVAHVAALDQDLGDAGEVEPGEVVAVVDALGPVIGALRHRRAAEKRLADIRADWLRVVDYRVVRPVRPRFQDRESPARRGAA